jgi:propanol-preferring alcohol dehydrogenase
VWLRFALPATGTDKETAATMRAMLLRRISDLAREKDPLELADIPVPVPADNEVLLEVNACGVCHTELDEIEGRTPPPLFPVVPGHEVIGRVVERGKTCTRLDIGTRVGVGWIHHSDATEFENLSDAFCATGRDVNGGYAEYMTVPERYACPVPDAFDDLAAAPLLCAGAVGYRALRLTGLRDGDVLGLTGFGGSGHLVLQYARHLYPSSPLYVFARDAGARQFARELGADWVGDTTATPPRPCRAVIDTTPAWQPVLAALAVLEPGGRLVINAIRKEAGDVRLMASIRYEKHLWLEKEIKSVANVTASDIADSMAVAAAIPVRVEVEPYALEAANEALLSLRAGAIRGAKVLAIRNTSHASGL